MQRVLFCATVTLLMLTSASLPGQSVFTLLSPKETGVAFANAIKETEELNVLAYEYFYNGGGVAAGDINNDGLIDLYFTSNMRSDKLYLNLGNLKFRDITKSAGIDNKNLWKTGVTMADVNADGHLDVYVCVSGNTNNTNRRNLLYINKGNNTFKESAREFGLDDSGYSTQAAFFDYDLDGDLDMFLVNHNVKDFKDIELVSVREQYDSLAGDKLYRNDNNHFTDIGPSAGIKANPIGFGLGLGVSDINNDGFPDIYISNDYQEHDYLYLNDGNGTFKEVSKTTFDHLSEFSMGNDIADVNNDGSMDIISVDMLPEDNRRQKLLQGPENYDLYQTHVRNGFHHQFMRNMLQINNGDGTFSEIGQLAGVSNTDWSWSAIFTDFDNDGWKDLFISNGYLRDYTNKDFLKYWGNYLVQKAMKMEQTLLMELVEKMPSTVTKNYVFKNGADLTFQNVTDRWGLSHPMLSNGATVADLDNDGDMDLVINNVNSPASIYRNNTSRNTSANFISVSFKGEGKNTSGVGCKVTLFTKSGRQYAENFLSRGFQSAVAPVLTFGMGTQTSIDSIRVDWPGGDSETKYNIVKDSKLVFYEKDAVRKKHFTTLRPPLFARTPAPLDVTGPGLIINDFKRQPLLPWMQSGSLPVTAKGDLNNDQLEDLVVLSQPGTPLRVFFQEQNEGFRETYHQVFPDDKNYFSAAASIFDCNNDGHNDIYVVAGGYHLVDEGNEELSDRIYLNDGNGNFSSRLVMPLKTNKTCVQVCDFDGDNDLDVFVGGGAVPGKYPLASLSYLLENDGKGKFTDVTHSKTPQLARLGITTDALWHDFNMDNRPDLLVCGHWLGLEIFINTPHGFVRKTPEYFSESYTGFWNKVVLSDLDGDGDKDIVAGNLGLNSQMKASAAEPVEMIYKDFDNNGSIDPFLSFFIQGKSYPVVSRDELLDQMYGMRRKFTNYESYANTQLKDWFTSEELKDAGKLEVTTLETSWFENVNGKFVRRALSLEAQFSPVTSILAEDLTFDGNPELLLFGNIDYARLKFGKLDANHGTLLQNGGSGKFKAMSQKDSGLQVKGDVKSSFLCSSGNATLLLLFKSNAPVEAYQLKAAKNDP